MKIIAGALVAALSAPFDFVLGGNSDSCVIGGFAFEFAGHCTYENVLQQYTIKFEDHKMRSADCPQDRSAEDDFWLQIDANNRTTAESIIHGVCGDAFERATEIAYTDIAREGTDYEFEREYYNGGTYWNDETETNYHKNVAGGAKNSLNKDARNVKYFYNAFAQQSHVEWPDQLSNFDSGTCTTSAAMCCWPRDRQANDNNGNCNTPYDKNCYDKNPGDNTDLCHMDLSNGNLSTEFGSSGTVVFPGDNDNGEGPVHCHGFAWANDENDYTNRYKANNLFFVSMYDHMYKRGYVENIPGAPMCACVEQMPTVSRSDCTQINVNEKFEFTYHPLEHFTAEITYIKISFNACQGLYNTNNDLYAYMGQLHKDGKVTSDQYVALNEVLVGNNNCKDATRYHFEERGLMHGYDAGEDYVQVAGRDIFYKPTYGLDAFNDVMESAASLREDFGIILRVCESCDMSHKFIYYKRLTPIPSDLNLLDHLLNHRKSYVNNGNTHGIDFTLFSTYEDAISGMNPWNCDYNHDELFPGRCAPNGEKANQQSRFYDKQFKPNVAFYANAGEAHEDFIYIGNDRTTGLASKDIGSTSLSGNALLKDGVYHVTGSGKGIWESSDHFHYLYETIDNTDKEITLVARIDGMDDHHEEWTKAGLMIRESLDSNAANAFVYVNKKHGVLLQSRNTAGSHTSTSWGDAKGKSHSWIMITRKGTKFRVYQSDDGINWEMAISEKNFPDTFLNSQTLYVGMAITSHSNNVLAGMTAEKYARYSRSSILHCEMSPETPSPTASPTVSAAPSNQVIKKYIVCGRPGKCGNRGPFKVVNSNTSHEVRCCSDSRIEGWVNHGTCPTVWGGSEFSQCFHAETYISAEDICSSNGARLCTKQELEDGCASQSGCGHDEDHVWSSTDGQSAHILAKFYSGSWTMLPNFEHREPYSSEYVWDIGFPNRFSFGAGRDINFGAVYEGRLQFPGKGEWELCTTSDDGSSLHINGLILVNNDGLHGTEEKCAGFSVVSDGEIAKVRVEFFQAIGDADLSVAWKSNGGVKTTIPKTAWV